MEHRQNKWIVALFALAVVGLVGMQPVAIAEPGGPMLQGSITIKDNEAKKVRAAGGVEAKASFLGIGGSGGKGLKDAPTVVQGVDVGGLKIDARIAIMGNKASEITNDGARLTVQGVSVRR